jgi:hypothetical protein
VIAVLGKKGGDAATPPLCVSDIDFFWQYTTLFQNHPSLYTQCIAMVSYTMSTLPLYMESPKLAGTVGPLEQGPVTDSSHH